MVTSRSTGIERSKRSPIVRPGSSTETARSWVQTSKGQEHFKRNHRLQHDRTWWQMWVSEKTNAHHEATASIAWEMTTKIQSLGNGKLAFRTAAEKILSFPRRVLIGNRGQPTFYSMREFYTNHGSQHLTQVNSPGSGMLNTSIHLVP